MRDLVIVAKVTTRSRAIPAEVSLGRGEGLPRESVANCDDLVTLSKRVLLKRIGDLGPAKTDDLDRALRFALGLA